MDVQDWQTNKHLADTNLYMLEHEIDGDVTFLVGEGKEEVKGHRFMLVSRSPVFYAMLLGPLAEKSNTVTVPDIDKKSFKAMLRFLYTEEITLEAETVMTMMYAAKKYGVQALVDKCSMFLKENMSTENVCIILNQAYMFDEDQLKKDCLTFIFEYGMSVLKSEGFLKLNKECLYAIVESTDLDVDGEVDVYNACVCWSREECKREGDAVTDEKCRQALGNIVFLIQFAAMGAEKFTHYVSSENILTNEEKVSFFQHFCSTNPDDSCVSQGPFKSTKGCRLRNETEISRFERAVGHLRCLRDEKVAVTFSCSEDILLVGVRLYIPIHVLGRLKGTLRVEQNGQVLSEQEIRLENTGTEKCQKTQKVMLDTRVPVKKDRQYEIIQNCAWAHTFNGENSISELAVNGVTFTFTDSALSQNFTRKSIGQIPTLIFR